MGATIQRLPVKEKVVVFVSLTASKLAKLLNVEGNFSKLFFLVFFLKT